MSKMAGSRLGEMPLRNRTESASRPRRMTASMAAATKEMATVPFSAAGAGRFDPRLTAASGSCNFAHPF
jgi:hypothetical protein